MIQSGRSVKPEDLEKAREIKAFLEKNYNVHYSYDDLVMKFGINNLKLKTAFKAVSNCNIHEFVTKVRMQNAKGMLANTDKTVRDIAKQVGLDKSNFIIQFKHLTGKTPTEWRRNPD
jgi:two-component system response regulator YesN